MSFHSPRLIWLHWAPVWHHLLRRPTIHFFSKLITLDPSTLEKAVYLDWIHTSSMGFPFPPTKSLVLGLQNLIHQHGISHYDSWLRVPLYSKVVDTILWDLLIEESRCWLKTYDFSGLAISDYKGITWQASQGKAALPTPELVHRQCTAITDKRGS